MMDHFLIKHRLVNKIALDTFVSDASSPSTKQLQILTTWPKGFRKVMLKAYAEFIELKLVHQDWDSSLIVAPYPLKCLWYSHSYRYDPICQKLFKHKIIYNSSTETDEQIQYTLKAYKLRFNREPRYWDFVASIQIWEKRIRNWDRRKLKRRLQLNNGFLDSEKPSSSVDNSSASKKIKIEPAHSPSLDVRTACLAPISGFHTQSTQVETRTENNLAPVPIIVNASEGQDNDISIVSVESKKVERRKRKTAITPLSCVTRSRNTPS